MGKLLKYFTVSLLMQMFKSHTKKNHVQFNFVYGVIGFYIKKSFLKFSLQTQIQFTFFVLVYA